MGLGLNKFRLDEEIKALASSGGSGLPSGPAGGALTGVYPNPGLTAGSATGSVLGTDVLTISRSFSGDVAGLWNALLLNDGAVVSSKLADGAATGTKLGLDVARLVNNLVPPANLGTGTADASHILSGANTWILPPGGPPSGAAGGSLAGFYPNPTLAAGVATGAVLGNDVVVTSQANVANGYAKPDAGNLLLAAMLGGGTPSSTTFLRGDRTWAVPAGGGGANSVFEFQPFFPAPNSGDSADMRSSVSTSITSVGAIRTGGTGTTVDFQKNGVTILTAPISLTATTWTAGTLVTNPTVFAATDLMTVVLSGVSGTPTKVLAAAYGTRATV